VQSKQLNYTTLKIKKNITKRSTECGISAALQNHIGYLRRYERKMKLTIQVIIIFLALTNSLVSQEINELKSFLIQHGLASKTSTVQEILNLEKIGFEKCKLTKSDFDLINKLPKLKFIRFIEVELDEIKSLKNLQELTFLEFYNSNLKNLDFLEPLKNLKTLRLSWTDIDDLTPLKGLKKLEVLDLIGTKVTNLKPLKELKALKNLDLTGTEIKNIEALRELEDLKSLDLTGTEIKNLEPLILLKNLESLNISFSKVTSLKELQKIQRYFSLTSFGVPIKSKTLEETIPFVEVNISVYSRTAIQRKLIRPKR
jgi:hypothetical protein